MLLSLFTIIPFILAESKQQQMILKFRNYLRKARQIRFDSTQADVPFPCSATHNHRLVFPDFQVMVVIEQLTQLFHSIVHFSVLAKTGCGLPSYSA